MTERHDERHKENAPGEWYVDTHCMDCSAARTVAPGLIVERGGQSVFARQPATPEELTMAWRARLLCPTGSVRTEHPQAQPKDVFPEEMTAGVYRLGYNAEHAYGAHSFLIRRAAGNMMVDSPRWAKPVVKQLEEWGGIAEILLSHQDDVGDADRYAAHFKARVAIHEADRDAAPYADRILEGTEPIALAPDILAIPVPRPHPRQRRLSLGPALPLHRRFTRVEFPAERPQRLSHILLVLVDPAALAPASARLSLRLGVRRPWRQSPPPRWRDAQTSRRTDRADGEAVAGRVRPSTRDAAHRGSG